MFDPRGTSRHPDGDRRGRGGRPIKARVKPPAREGPALQRGGPLVVLLTVRSLGGLRRVRRPELEILSIARRNRGWRRTSKNGQSHPPTFRISMAIISPSRNIASIGGGGGKSRRASLFGRNPAMIGITMARPRRLVTPRRIVRYRGVRQS